MPRAPATAKSPATDASAPLASAVVLSPAIEKLKHAMWQQITGRAPGASVAQARALVDEAEAAMQARAQQQPPSPPGAPTHANAPAHEHPQAHAHARAQPNPTTTSQADIAEVAFLKLFADFSNPTPQFNTLADRALALTDPTQGAQRVAEIWALRAFVHGVRDELTDVARCARQALHLAAASNHFARVYAHLALAGSLHWIGEFEETSAHLGPALVSARASGDAFLHLVALRQLALSEAKEARHQWERGEVSPQTLSQAETDVRGAIELTLRLAPTSSATYLHVYLAELLVLQKQFAAALLLLDQHLPLARSTTVWQLIAMAASRRALCLCALGRLDEALADSEEAQQACTHHHDPDLQGMVHADHASVLRAMGRADEAATHDRLAEEHRQRHQQLRVQHRDTLLLALAQAKLAAKA
jgi:ATP/maltotriose-dependent transcriptional regulator MalT